MTMPKYSNLARLKQIVVAACLLACSTTLLQAQEDDGPAAKDNDQVLQDWDRLIYVPFKELKEVFGNQNSSAVLPYAEYMELMKAYLESRNGAQKAPEAVITSATYQAVVENDVVRISTELKINLLGDNGWKSLTLPFGNCAIGNLESAEQDCLLKGRPDGSYELWLKGTGTKTVSVSLLTTVNRSPEYQSFSIQCPATAIGTLKVTIPRADQEVSILPPQIVQLEDSSEKEGTSEDNASASKDASESSSEDDDEPEVANTAVTASLSSTNRFEVRWNPKASSKPIMDLLATATNETQLRIEPGLLQTQTKLTYDILRGELTEARIAVPKSARIIDVMAVQGQIQSWEVEAAAESSEQQILKLQLLNPVVDQFEVKVESELDLTENSVAVLGRSEERTDGVHALDVIRETGTISVTTDSTLNATAKEMSSIRRIRLQQGKAASEQQSWSFVGQTGRLVLELSPVEPRILANQSADVLFEEDQIRVQSQITYTVERAGVFQLAVRYPEDLVIDSVEADGMTEFKSDQRSGLLTLSLAQKRLGKITVDIEAHRSFDSAVSLESVTMPVLDAQEVEREEGRIRVLAPQFLDVITIEDSVKGLFPDQEASTKGTGKNVVVSAWKYSRKPVAIAVRTSPRSAQISATVATTATVDPNVMKMNSRVTFDVRNAGIDTYRVSVPEEIASDVRFRSLKNGQTIQQRNQGDAVDGRVTWTLVLQNEVMGQVPFSVDWEVPYATDSEDSPNDDQTAEAAESDSSNQKTLITLLLPEVIAPFEDGEENRRAATITGVTGELRLLRHDSLSVSANAIDDSMEAVDVRELKLMDSSGYLAFRYFEQPASAQIQVTRHDVQEVVETVVSKAAIEVVTDRQRLASYLCQYEITSSERQRLRIDLPANAELQAPRLNGSRTTFEAADDVEAQNGWQAYFVNISRKSESDEPFILTLQFRYPISSDETFPFQGQGGRQVLRLPALTMADEAVVVQETRLAVYHPEKVALVGDAEQWKHVGATQWNLSTPLISSTSQKEAAALRQWISDAPETTDFARQGHVTVYRTLGHQSVIRTTWWNRPFLVGIISGALFLIGVILRRTSWENRLAIVVLAVLGISIWSLQDRSQTMQFFTAAVPGLAAVGVVWLVSFARSITSGQTKAPPAEPPEPQSETAPPPETPQPSHPDPKENADATTTLPPGTISPSPDVTRMIDDMMGGK